MPKKELSFSDLQQELQQVVDSLQQTTDVDAAIKLYEQGLELTKQIETYLANAQNTINKLDKKFDQVS